MHKNDLQQYIHENIPLTKAMGVMVYDISKTEVVLGVPLEPNTNHKNTAFGGSLHSLATLACWTLVYMNLADEESSYEIVISKSDIKYRAPVTNDFKAECHFNDDDELTHFLETLHRKGKARLRLNAHIYQGDVLAVDYWGDFAVIKV